MIKTNKNNNFKYFYETLLNYFNNVFSFTMKKMENKCLTTFSKHFKTS